MKNKIVKIKIKIKRNCFTYTKTFTGLNFKYKSIKFINIIINLGYNFTSGKLETKYNLRSFTIERYEL